jgi:hypothetical protein
VASGGTPKAAHLFRPEVFNQQPKAAQRRPVVMRRTGWCPDLQWRTPPSHASSIDRGFALHVHDGAPFGARRARA